jgi:hypothetical protein
LHTIRWIFGCVDYRLWGPGEFPHDSVSAATGAASGWHYVEACWFLTTCVGQEVYQQTHPLLFSDRALYIVVYSLLTEINAGDLQRHLKNVTIRCRDAPILLVGTHCDKVGGDSTLPLLALKKQFPQVGARVLLTLSDVS